MTETHHQHLWELSTEPPDCECPPDDCSCLDEPCHCGATTANTCTCP